MLFNSFNFLIFFPIVVLIYFIIPYKVRYIWLLVCSYFFYMCWNVKYVLILLFSTFITYISSILINNVENKKMNKNKKSKYKKVFVALSLIINLSILFAFKYFDFAVLNINKVLQHLNMQLLNPSFDVILPVGISFYTFQALGYTIDVYRKDVKVEKNFLRYALFVSFFPQLVAGPIERSKNLLGQIYEKHNFDYDRFKDGFMLMLWGFFLKIVVADRIAVIVDTVFDKFPLYGGMYIVVGAVLFAFQIYCDFAGYSTIAVGAAKIMGFRLMENFNSPYMSLSVAEFWRRWHISLSTWFRDYLYIPLGGNRKGRLRKNMNLMIVFLVSGLWHGANWSFVIWGGLNGLFQIIGDITKNTRNKLVKLMHFNKNTFSHKLVQLLITFTLVDFTWIFFRASGCRQALRMIKSIFTKYNPWILFNDNLYNLGLDRKEFNLMLFSIILLIIVDFVKWKGYSIRKWVNNQEWWFRCLFIALAICFILLFGKYGPAFDKNNFIYFQF